MHPDPVHPPSSQIMAIQRVEEGWEFGRAEYDSVTVGEDTLGDVLAKLGPPSRYECSLEGEVLEYLHTLSKGTDFSFSAFYQSVPFLGTVVGALRQTFGLAVDRGGEPSLFQRDPVTLFLPQLLVSGASAATGDFAQEEVLELINRQIDFDWLRVVIDRDTARVVEKSYRNARTREAEWVESTILNDD